MGSGPGELPQNIGRRRLHQDGQRQVADHAGDPQRRRRRDTRSTVVAQQEPHYQ
jgi:hypothetical protein